MTCLNVKIIYFSISTNHVGQYNKQLHVHVLMNNQNVITWTSFVLVIHCEVLRTLV